MKKTRKALTSLYALAAVVIALAFVTAIKGQDDFCVAVSVQGGSCANKICSGKLTGVVQGGSNFFCTASVPANGNCDETVICDNISPMPLKNAPPIIE